MNAKHIAQSVLTIILSFVAMTLIKKGLSFLPTLILDVFGYALIGVFALCIIAMIGGGVYEIYSDFYDDFGFFFSIIISTIMVCFFCFCFATAVFVVYWLTLNNPFSGTQTVLLITSIIVIYAIGCGIYDAKKEDDEQNKQL